MIGVKALQVKAWGEAPSVAPGDLSPKVAFLVVETVGDEMRVTLHGKPAGYEKSSGIGYATKSKIERRR